MTNATANASATVPLSRVTARDDLIFVAHRSGHFKHLLAAIKAAGLTDLFAGDDLYTVFAPNDKAFDRLARHALADLLKPESKTRLLAILKLHVVAGHMKAAAPGGQSVALMSLLGEELTLDTVHGLRVNRARIVERDIQACNGVIHEIDSVLIPAAG